MPPNTEVASDRQDTPSNDDKVNINGYTHTRMNKSRMNDIYSDIPVSDVIYKTPKINRSYLCCNALLIPLANTFTREKLRIIPSQADRVLMSAFPEIKRKSYMQMKRPVSSQKEKTKLLNRHHIYGLILLVQIIH